MIIGNGVDHRYLHLTSTFRYLLITAFTNVPIDYRPRLIDSKLSHSRRTQESWCSCGHLPRATRSKERQAACVRVGVRAESDWANLAPSEETSQRQQCIGRAHPLPCVLQNCRLSSGVAVQKTAATKAADEQAAGWHYTCLRMEACQPLGVRSELIERSLP